MVRVNRNRKPDEYLKYEMQTTLIGRHELELLRKAKELLLNPDESCTCSERKGRSTKWMKFSN